MSTHHRNQGNAAWRRLRADVLARDGFECRLRIPNVCTGRATAVDHVIPVSVWPDGELVESNLVAACAKCNRRKSDKVSGWRAPQGEVNPYDFV